MSAVVVGFVPTPSGEAALKVATAEALRRELQLVVVMSRHGERNYGEAEAAADRQLLDRVRTQAAAAGVEPDIRYLVRGREPAEDLLEVAGEVGAVLVVIGVRRRTPMGKLIMGSDAQRILLEAEMPVLAVKAPPE